MSLAEIFARSDAVLLLDFDGRWRTCSRGAADRGSQKRPVRPFVLGRPFARPDLMKPDPGLAAEALRRLGTTRACMVGDAVTNIEFAHGAGLTAIGYAKNPKLELELADADAIVHSMTEPADAARHVPA